MSKYVTTFTIAFIAGCIAAGCITGFSEMGRYFLLLTTPCLFRMSMCRKLPNVPAIPITNFWFRPWMVIDMSNLMMKFFGLKRQTK